MNNTENMRLIDQVALLKALDSNNDVYAQSETKQLIRNIIRSMPIVEAVPVVCAKWIEDGDYQVCSNCGDEHSWDEYRASYCECCGAQMN